MASAGRGNAVNILRTLYRELRPTVNQPQTNVYQTQLWKHIVGLCKNCKIQPAAKIEESQKNLEETGRLYILYLQSSKEYHRISDMYKGAGERTAQDTAKMLGFKMPNEPRDDSKLKSTAKSHSNTSNATTISGSSNDPSMSPPSATAHCPP